MHAHCHPSYPSLPHHPFLVLGLLAVRILVLLRQVTILVTILGICPRLYLPRRARRGRVLHRGFRLGDYDTIPVTHIRNERHNTTILVGTTSAFDAGGELDGQLLRTLASRILGDMSQYEDKLHDGQCVHFHRW
jgi:hypothetical protein